MIVRRIPMLAVTVAAFAAIGLVAREAPATITPVFSVQAAAWMPALPTSAALTSTWFCPGVPATGAAGTGGDIVVANAGDTAMTEAAARKRRKVM